MGIRFYCPQGHKLNVKSFLAGKVGVCPHCDARVQIPFTSTRPSSKALDQGGENQETALPLASPLEDVDQVLPVAEAIDGLLKDVEELKKKSGTETKAKKKKHTPPIGRVAGFN